jgi:hypothetical protein
MSRLASPLHWDGACSLLSGQNEQREEQIKIARARQKILLRKPIFVYFSLGGCSRQVQALNVISLLLGFAGAAFAFMDSVRTASRFTSDGILLGYPPNRDTLVWRLSGRLGFGLLAAAFAVQLVCAFYY